MVVAHTNDFGLGAAGAVLNIRLHFSDRSIHLHTFLNPPLAKSEATVTRGVSLWLRN